MGGVFGNLPIVTTSLRYRGCVSKLPDLSLRLQHLTAAKAAEVSVIERMPSHGEGISRAYTRRLHAYPIQAQLRLRALKMPCSDVIGNPDMTIRPSR